MAKQIFKVRFVYGQHIIDVPVLKIEPRWLLFLSRSEQRLYEFRIVSRERCRLERRRNLFLSECRLSAGKLFRQKPRNYCRLYKHLHDGFCFWNPEKLEEERMFLSECRLSAGPPPLQPWKHCPLETQPSSRNLRLESECSFAKDMVLRKLIPNICYSIYDNLFWEWRSLVYTCESGFFYRFSCFREE